MLVIFWRLKVYNTAGLLWLSMRVIIDCIGNRTLIWLDWRVFQDVVLDILSAIVGLIDHSMQVNSTHRTGRRINIVWVWFTFLLEVILGAEIRAIIMRHSFVIFGRREFVPVHLTVAHAVRLHSWLHLVTTNLRLREKRLRSTYRWALIIDLGFEWIRHLRESLHRASFVIACGISLSRLKLLMYVCLIHSVNVIFIIVARVICMHGRLFEESIILRLKRHNLTLFGSHAVDTFK